MTLILLLVAGAGFSVVIGTLAKLPPRELVLQTAAVCGALLIFYGLVDLLA